MWTHNPCANANRIPRIVALILILVLCANQAAVAADKHPRQVPWSGLPALIEGHKFGAELTNGVRIRGKGAKITGQEMQINVIETSDATLVPLGLNRLSARHFDTITIHRGSVGRRIAFGVLLGLAGAGLSVFAVAAEWLGESVNGDDKWVLMLPIVFGAVGGAFLGGRRPLIVQVLHKSEHDAVPTLSPTAGPAIEN
ncbi:MAG: hypothetical protein C0504_00535 [Candidatus Solibacter sp.]|nr:hypothetical protein [Candidatus Solibacter sp.]